MTITDLQRQQKEILTIERHQFVVLSMVMLNGFSVNPTDLQLQYIAALKRNTALRKLTTREVDAVIASLERQGFLHQAYRTLEVPADWQRPLFFSADALGQETLLSLVHVITSEKQWPSNGGLGNTWRINFADIRVRLLHKILINKERHFQALMRHVVEPSRYYEAAQLKLTKEINGYLATIAPDFWAKRSLFFQESHLNAQQSTYAEWKQDTPARILPMLRQSGGAEDVGDYSEDLRVITLLGAHYFRHHIDAFAFDPGLRGVLYLLNGNEKAADAAFAQLVEPEEEASIVEVIQIARGIGSGQMKIPEVIRRVNSMRYSSYPKMINAFIGFSLTRTGDVRKGEDLINVVLQEKIDHPLVWMVVLWTLNWAGIKPRQKATLAAQQLLADDELANVPYVRAEMANSLLTLYPNHEATEQWKTYLHYDEQEARTWSAAESRTQSGQGVKPVLLQSLVTIRPAWERALRKLRQVNSRQKAGPETVGENEYRTIWVVDFDTQVIMVKEQKRGAKGWSKGRRMKWTELITPKRPEALERADQQALGALQTFDGRRLSASMHYSDDSLWVDFGQMLYEIADHPRIYLDDKRRIPIELIRAEPQLIVTDTAEGLMMRFDPPVEADGYVWHKETPTRYRVYHLNEAQGEMAFAIGAGIEVPEAERQAVEEIVENIRPAVNVQSTFDLIDEDLEQVTGSTLPCVHLLPFEDGYQVAVYVRPVPEEPIYFKPGDGLPRSVIVTEEGRKILHRDLKAEVAEVAAMLEACPLLNTIEGSHYEYNIPDTRTALRVLLELRVLVDEQLISIEHPKGEKLKIVGTAGSNELALKVGKNRDWFEVDGKLTVNEERVLDLEALLEHMKNREDSKFVELKSGEFLELTDELRDRILEMEGLLHKKGSTNRLPTLAAGAFAELAEDLAELETDTAWAESLERIKKAERIRPRVPKTFRAELRDYQKEGFRWLMRLAEWGVGGCLADDMGLGKTVQGLAMLSARADKGPALVIAPASVTRNWQAETERFTPDLIPVLIASRQDTELLTQLGAGDVALVSYGLLSFIGDELQALEWATIVLDEAQAIKNTATKRAKIVQNLNADFKLATTGTPIENHLGELWSLFRFLNPGLLGGKTAFNEKYNRPIVRGDDERREALKRIVKPFILRRRKDQVLTELPPKTEIVLSVDLSDEEKALYEAMRRQALKDIAAADEQQKRFTVLAQLTKLRQAACHPRLVRPTSKIGSAKLELVGETLLEILESGHKALIFSQFVKHLKIVENWVKGQGVAYQYLDGSTPGKQREKSVNAFQNGEGDVFLISLKAGGTGLNLTAADYVLHLDPWWNPAAEDQASDRAHRIGQQRPVTVYRFVSQGTIEEQIIALHAEKRDLADQILSGTGKAGALKVEEVLAMIRDDR